MEGDGSPLFNANYLNSISYRYLKKYKNNSSPKTTILGFFVSNKTRYSKNSKSLHISTFLRSQVQTKCTEM